jgi:hypothetical protein
MGRVRSRIPELRSLETARLSVYAAFPAAIGVKGTFRVSGSVHQRCL